MKKPSFRAVAWPGEAPDFRIQLRQILAFAFQQGLPVALWRLPNMQQAQLCLSFSDEAAFVGLTPVLEPKAPAGFAFFPFRDSDHNPAQFLPANVFFDTANPTELQISTALEEEDEAHMQELLAFLGTAPPSSSTPLTWHVSPQPVPHTATRAEYAALVRKAVATIEQGHLRKVVSSRAARQLLPVGFDVLVAFGELHRRYPTAFVSLVSTPSAGTWLGATPEKLVEVDEDGVFRTMALAGTQPLTPDLTPQTAMWTGKEIEEQALVARYIVSCFKQLRLRDYDEIGPRTAAAGQLLHLRTDFAVPLRQVPHPTLATDMLRLLHPTSAVGGMPRQAALDFLQAYEGYDRAYYSGFLGPVNMPNPGIARVFVNLRCLQLREDEAILYAGTGLTAFSDPLREWTETELKLATAGAVLGGKVD
ncbi:chorismate-binding protein [Hymenobacter crusticola]|uniref:chorismate-binding protein n=1 Tax=Hymenobacter crusticola TaxID=1770526 RepID=UPI000A3BD8ED|nr:chorismate-binding protein [Hymenobacter crusticola]